MNVRAAGGLADGVQVQAAEVAPQVSNGLEVSLGLAQPLRQARPGNGFDLDERLLVGHKPLFSHGWAIARLAVFEDLECCIRVGQAFVGPRNKDNCPIRVDANNQAYDTSRKDSCFGHGTSDP